MNIPLVRIVGAGLLSFPILLHAQGTWAGGTNGNSFNAASNWTPNASPSGASTLTFGASAFTGISFPANASAASLTFAVGAPKYTFNASGPFTLSLGAGGLTTNSGGAGLDVSNNVGVSLTANQTWTIASGANVTVNGNVSGAGALTKEGAGYLVLSGTNSYSGGTTVNAGALYLGSSNSGSGTVTVGGSGTLGSAFGDTALSNAVTLNNGATIGGTVFGGGQVKLTGAVTVADTAANFTVGSYTDAYFGGSLVAANPTALTVNSDGTGVSIMANSQTNITSVTANNSAVVFANELALPTTQIHATNGGYVSVGTLAGVTPPTAPTVGAFMALITDKTNFNGVIGFDTDDEAAHPTTYSSNINLSGFTNGNVRIGSITSAILTGSITPVAQSYDFGGYASQDGLLVVKSSLANNVSATGLTVVSAAASGGAPQNGMILALQGANTFTGNLSLSYASLILDSAGALPTGSTINLGAYSYAGYTENLYSGPFTDFSSFVGRIGTTTATSILGIDSRDTISDYVDSNPGTSSTHTITDATINLSGFSSIFLGTMTGAEISAGTSIAAPTDGTLRFVSMSDDGFTIKSTLTQGNGMVIGMAGSEGYVTLTGNNTFSGNTSLQGGGLLLGHANALSSGSLAITNTGNDTVVLGASSASVAIANNISVTGQATIGTGGYNESGTTYTAGTNALTLNGAITGTGSLYITGVTTLGGNNTYSGGTLIRANTTVTSDSGLGSGPVTLGFAGTATKSQLTFSSATPTIGNLANASNFMFGGGTGDIIVGSGVNLTINQTIPTPAPYGGDISGAGGITKTGGATLVLAGNNSYTGATFVSGGTLVVANALSSSSVTVASGATLIGTGSLNDVTLNGTYRPGPTGGTSITTIDSLTMSPSGLLHMEIGGATIGSQYDSLNITGGSGIFTADGTLSVTFLNGYNPGIGASFNLFDFTSMAGTFDSLTLASLGGGKAWDTSALYTTGVLSVTAVPEPATSAALVGVGMLAFVAWRRRMAAKSAAMQVVARL